jgi:hypothetical protein
MAAKVSQSYTLAFLVKHPISKEIVLKHLTPLGLDAGHISRVDATLSALMGNMGGGIPYKVIVTLMEELDQHSIQEFEKATKDDYHENSF